MKMGAPFNVQKLNILGLRALIFCLLWRFLKSWLAWPFWPRYFAIFKKLKNQNCAALKVIKMCAPWNSWKLDDAKFINLNRFGPHFWDLFYRFTHILNKKTQPGPSGLALEVCSLKVTKLCMPWNSRKLYDTKFKNRFAQVFCELKFFPRRVLTNQT